MKNSIMILAILVLGFNFAIAQSDSVLANKLAAMDEQIAKIMHEKSALLYGAVDSVHVSVSAKIADKFLSKLEECKKNIYKEKNDPQKVFISKDGFEIFNEENGAMLALKVVKIAGSKKADFIFISNDKKLAAALKDIPEENLRSYVTFGMILFSDAEKLIESIAKNIACVVGVAMDEATKDFVE